ncbi:Gfo/Idh/MocA family oxidoreductase [Streptomyces beijiangensis]|uniref:Gfo/Idh/MocA family oxidoreductase n=1 Tax=Streptomyces beijiangensis TaxID=163361 RepID=A0A939F6Y4_9ACTN|nr:Gfo/Idh/MocA family oxidoreductase [Streptomyces beijiangensis]MBO0512981.1 Gfo/Idh/MocA family oxidoreductase [Streptomyces beijiangensis]
MPIKVGVVGVGPAALYAASSLRIAGGFEVHSVLDLSDAIRAKPGSQYRCDNLIEQRAVDLLVLCSGSELRVELVRAALAKGIAVLIEEPPPLSSAELEELIEAAEVGGAAIGTQSSLRMLLSDSNLALDSLAWTGDACGSVTVSGFLPSEDFRVRSWSALEGRWKRRAVIRSLAPYLDLAINLLGRPTGVHFSDAERGSATGTIHFESGAQLALASTVSSSLAVARLEVIGLQQVLTVDHEAVRVETDSSTWSIPTPSPQQFRQLVYEDMARAIRSGSQPLYCGLARGAGLTQALEMLRRQH